MNRKCIMLIFITFFLIQSSIVEGQTKQNDFYPSDNVYTVYNVSFGGSPMVSIINTTKSNNLTDVTQTGFLDIQNPQSAKISLNYTYTNPYLLENVWSEVKNASQTYSYAYASYINTTTRKYVTGIFQNHTTPGYIDPRNINVNDTLDIQGGLYNVTKIGSVTLNSGLTRDAIWVTTINPNLVKVWYDKDTGIMLKLEFNLTYTNNLAINANFKVQKQSESTGLKIQELTSTNAFSMSQASQKSKTADVPLISIFIALATILVYKKKKL